MKNNIVLLASSVMIPVFCLATSISDPRQRLLLDRISTMTSTPSEASTAAFELLKLVALGRTQEISAELEARAGLAAGEIQQKEFSDSSIRAYAFRKIGETSWSEAENFLANLKLNDIGLDPSQQIWPSAQIALNYARLKKIQDTQSQIEFLKGTLTEPHDAISNSAVTTWAVTQLCDRGAHTAFPEIQMSIRSRMERQDGDDEIRFCEARIQVVFRHPDRAKALGSVLRVADVTEDDRLVGWAISQLADMRSSTADAELNRFAMEIGQVPKDSPRNQRLSRFKSEIDTTLDKKQRHRSLLQ